MTHKKIAALFIAASLLSPALAYAHGDGASFEATSSPYLIDVGYEPEEFVAGYASTFDFGLSDEDGKDIEFETVWVRFTKDGKTYFATGLGKQLIGRTTLLYVFDSPGTYELHVSYRRGGEEVAEAAFPFEVESGEEGSTLPLTAIIGFVLGALLGAGAMFIRR